MQKVKNDGNSKRYIDICLILPTSNICEYIFKSFASYNIDDYGRIFRQSYYWGVYTSSQCYIRVGASRCSQSAQYLR